MSAPEADADAAADVARWRGWRGAAAWLALLVAVLLRFHPLLSLDATFPQHDWLQAHQTDAEHVLLAAHDGSIVPLWSPYLLCGSPLYGVATKPFSYPPFLLAVPLLGAPGAMNVLALLHLLLAGAGMLLLARRLHCGPAAGAAAAIAFVLGTWPGAMFKSQPFWAYAVAWWPWAAAAALDVLDSRDGRRQVSGATLLGVFMALQVLAGGVFQAYWLASFLALFALPFLLRRGDETGAARRLALLGGAALLCLLLSAARVLPALAWMQVSGRSEGLSSDEILSGYDQLSTEGGGGAALEILRVMLFRRDRLGTWTLLAGCGLALALSRQRRAAWGAAAGVALCVVIASGLPHELLADWLPGYDRMRLPYRFLAPAGFGAALLLALGVDAALARLPRGAARVALVLGAALLALDLQLVPGVRWLVPATSSAAELQALAEPVLGPLQDGSGARFHAPSARFQTLSVARGLRCTLGLLGGPGSESPAFAAWFPPEASPLEMEAQHKGVLDVLAVRWTTSFTPLAAPWLTLSYEPRLRQPPRGARSGRVRLDALGELDPYEAYLLRDAQSGEGEAYRRPSVYERAGALPHASLVARPLLVTGESAARAAAIHAALDRRSFDAHATVFLEDPALDPATLSTAELDALAGVLFTGAAASSPTPGTLVQRAGGELTVQGSDMLWTPAAGSAPGLQPLDERLVTSRCNDLSLQLPEGGPPLLLLSETFPLHPGWTARVDGQRVPMLHADGCITALRLPQGARRVEFRYWPEGLTAGLAISTASLALLIACAIAWRRRA